MASLPRLAIRGLDKTFGPAKVLSGVDLAVDPGEIHGLAGQNGSGKSTLVKIVTGVYAPDAGAVLEVDGRPVRLPVRWPDVHAAGVSVVHQDLGILDELTVADNVCAGGFPRHRFTRRIDRRRLADVARVALHRVGADIDPGRPAETLSGPERAEVALARALRDHRPGAGLIIMDESTRTLTGAALDRMHDILKSLARDGTSILLISHSLPELIAVTDRVTVLRDGRVSGSGLSTDGLSEHEIASRMLGEDAVPGDIEPAHVVRSDQARLSDDPALVVTGLSGRRVHDVSFSVGRGEVVGITGLPGSGYEDIPYLLTGALGPREGLLVREGRHTELAQMSVARSLRAGMVLVPEQRGKHGLALELTVRDNVTLPNLGRRGRRWFLGRQWQQRDVAAAIDAFDIRPPSADRLVKSLSGGNQQKVLLAKWMGAVPAVMVLHEPTQAVDVGARRDILLAIRRAAEDGVAVVLVSAEPSDLLAICDRIHVAVPGGGVTEVRAATADDLLSHIYADDRTPVNANEKAGAPHA
ncbi:sugar ABC transporter ATP-binding protein [Nocardioides sp. AN3]